MLSALTLKVKLLYLANDRTYEQYSLIATKKLN